MTLRTRLLLAQVPLAIALAAVGVLGVATLDRVGQSSQLILKDNYRSVLAAQKMKEALERIDSGALFVVGGRREKGLGQIEEYRPRFDEQLRFQETNITEPGEAEKTRALRQTWTAYDAELARLAEVDAASAADHYFQRLEPAFLAVKRSADAILDVNQDAMSHKSEAARRTAARVNATMLGGAIAAFILGLVASVTLTARVLRPLGVLTQAVRRLGEGDLETRAHLSGGDEISQLATDFNAMAEHLATYRKSSLGELLQAQAASQAAIDSLPDPVLVFGAGGQLLNVNAAANQSLGLSLEVSGSAPLGAAAPDVRAALERIRAHVLSGKGAYVPRGFEDALRVHAGEAERWFLPRATPVQGAESALAGATVILQDVTRLRRFDELKDDLVASVAHEFRTPLTSLRMAIHLCLEERAGPITPRQADLLQAAREDCERLQGIVDDLLDLSKLQAGRELLAREPVAVSRLIDAAIAAHTFEAVEAGAGLRGDTLETGEVLADRERVPLVFSNLIRNALRHAPKGTEVSVKARRLGRAVRFEVHDEGPGLAAEHQARVFDKFFRVPGSAGGGAGLGLSIAREIVLAHGGEIGVDSELGRGSTFWFDLPAV